MPAYKRVCKCVYDYLYEYVLVCINPTLQAVTESHFYDECICSLSKILPFIQWLSYQVKFIVYPAIFP